jgi:hypothetical protein
VAQLRVPTSHACVNDTFEGCSTFHVTGFELGIVESSAAELILGALVRFVRVRCFWA